MTYRVRRPARSATLYICGTHRYERAHSAIGCSSVCRTRSGLQCLAGALAQGLLSARTSRLVPIPSSDSILYEQATREPEGLRIPIFELGYERRNAKERRSRLWS